VNGFHVPGNRAKVRKLKAPSSRNSIEQSGSLCLQSGRGVPKLRAVSNGSLATWKHSDWQCRWIGNHKLAQRKRSTGGSRIPARDPPVIPVIKDKRG